MADVVTTVTHEGEEAADRTEESTERAVGRLEAEAEHHGDTLEEHEEKIADIKEDAEWIRKRFDAMEQTIAEIPRFPTEVLEEMRTEVRALTEKIEKIPSSAVSLTQPPEEAKHEAQEAPKRQSVLHRLL